MKKNGFLIGIIGFLIALAATAVFYILTLFITGIVVQSIFGNTAALATYPFAVSGLPFAIFVLFDVIFFTTQAKRIIGEDIEKLGVKKDKLLLIARIIAIICVLALLCCIVLNIGWRNEFHDDSIKKVFFVTQKEYKPENVLKYSLVINEYGNAEFTVTMKDGESFELFNNINTCSDAFADKYGTGQDIKEKKTNFMYGYAAHLSELYDNSGNDIAKHIEWDESITYDPADPNYESMWKYLIMIAGRDY